APAGVALPRAAASASQPLPRGQQRPRRSPCLRCPLSASRGSSMVFLPLWQTSTVSPPILPSGPNGITTQPVTATASSAARISFMSVPPDGWRAAKPGILPHLHATNRVARPRVSNPRAAGSPARWGVLAGRTRKVRGEHGAVRLGGLHVDGAAVRTHDLRDDVEAQAHAAGPGADVRAAHHGL